MSDENISEEEYRRRVLQLLETIMKDISDLSRCVERSNSPRVQTYIRTVQIPEPKEYY